VTELDVAIVGGGPAGTAAALTLLRYSKLRPVVIERSSYDEWRVGETLAPGVLPLLDYLDARAVVDPELRAYGTRAAWGSSNVVSRAFLFTGAGDAWHLDRRRFDAALASLVRERGGTVLTNTVIESIDERRMLRLSNGSTIAAPFVIDASGRHAAFARMQGARADIVDHLTGVVGIFDGDADGDDAATLVESFEDGWWYSARLPGGGFVAALMTDADIIRERRLYERDEWHEQLARTRATRLRAEPHTLARDPIVCPANSQIANPVAGDGWVAAGDAAVSFDPLSSMGIGYAIASGIQAARVAASPSPAMLDAYAADVRRHFAAYLSRRAEYYAIEQRWPESAFCKRRK